MKESQTDVKVETPDESVTTQSVTEDVKNEVPYARFKEVNDNYKSIKSDYDSLAQKVSNMEEAKLISEGKKDDVIANLKGTNADLNKRVESLSSYVNDERKRLLEAFPEEKRDIYADVDLLVLRDMASERQELLNKKVGVDKARGGTSMNPPKAFHEMSPEEKSDPAIWQSYLKSFRRK